MAGFAGLGVGWGLGLMRGRLVLAFILALRAFRGVGLISACLPCLRGVVALVLMVLALVLDGLGFGFGWSWHDTPDTHPPKEKIFFANPDGLITEPGRTPRTVETNGESVCAPSPAGHGKRRKHKPRRGYKQNPEESQRTQTTNGGGKKNFFFGGVAAVAMCAPAFFANPDGLITEPGRTPRTVETNGESVCAPSPAGHGKRRKHKPRRGYKQNPEESQRT